MLINSLEDTGSPQMDNTSQLSTPKLALWTFFGPNIDT